MIVKGGCSLGLGERRKTCTPTKGIVFGVSECVREKYCGELIECAHKVMRDGFKVEPRKITCGGVCVSTKEGNLATVRGGLVGELVILQ